MDVVKDERANSAAPSMPPQVLLLQTGLGYVASVCLNIAVKLGIADVLADGPLAVEAIAERCGVDAGHLRRVLRVLEMQGIFMRDGQGRFGLTDASSMLRTDVPGSMADMAEWICDPFHMVEYSDLLQTVTNGDVAFDRMHGEPFFAWLCRPENAAEADVFNRAMTSLSGQCAPAVVAGYDFSQHKRVVDVGGGHGALLCQILEANPGVSGTVADMPGVVAGARASLAQSALAERCDAADCDFFAAVPSGGDCYVMKHIIHDWKDEQALAILRNVRSAIADGGKVVLVECVLDDSPAPHPAKLLDIEMMALVGGKERTADEFAALLAAAGFRMERVIPTKSPVALIEATAV